MKTWTNPSVEELEVKLTASMQHPWYHEENNGYWDGNKWWGSANGSSGSEGEGSEGSGSEGNGSETGSETLGPNS